MTEPSQQPSSEDTAFFGHPRGLGYIVATEACYAFAYYGMVTILTLYMTQQLFTPGHVENILGFGAYSHLMQGVFGEKTPLALASLTFGLATSLGYATPMLGGLIGDRWLGQRRTVILGLGLLAAGYAALVTEQGFLIAIALIVVGAGLVKSNLLGQLGRLYGPDDPRRTRAFALFLVAVNVGGLLTPLVVGTLGEKVGWAQGLLAAAISMGLGLVVYLAGGRHLPSDVLSEARAPAAERVRLTPHDWRVIAALLLVLVAATLNTGSYNQAFNIFPVWAKAHVNLNLFGFQMPVTWFSAMDGILTIIGIAVAVRFWAWQASREPEPRETSRVAIGCALTAAGFLMLVLGSLAAAGGKVAIIAPVLFFILVDSAIPWIDTVIQAFFSRAAPAGTTTTMLGAYYLSFAGGNFLVGLLGSFYEAMSPTVFWLIHAAIVGFGALFLILVGPSLYRLITPPAAAGSTRAVSA